MRSPLVILYALRQCQHVQDMAKMVNLPPAELAEVLNNLDVTIAPKADLAPVHFPGGIFPNRDDHPKGLSGHAVTRPKYIVKADRAQHAEDEAKRIRFLAEVKS